MIKKLLDKITTPEQEEQKILLVDESRRKGCHLEGLFTYLVKQSNF